MTEECFDKAKMYKWPEYAQKIIDFNLIKLDRLVTIA